MIRLVIPKQDAIAVTSGTSEKTGRSWTRTDFTAQNAETGMIYAPCQSMGDRKIFLEKLMNDKREIEIPDDALVHDTTYPKWPKWRVRLPDGSETGRPAGSGWSSGGRSFGGGPRPWVPNGYQGRRLTVEEYHTLAKEAWDGYFEQALAKIQGLVMSTQTMAAKDEAVARILSACVASATTRSDQFLISLERNVLEMGQPSTPSVTTPQPTTTTSPSAPAPPSPGVGGVADLMRQAITAATTSEQLNALTEDIKTNPALAGDEKSALFLAAYHRRAALGLTGGVQ